MPTRADGRGSNRKISIPMKFNELGLAAPLLKALEDEGYTTPTPIQAQAIPALLAGSDMLGIAQTGTGKTAAFALPLLHRLAADKRPAPRRGARVLVLSPTRELAAQIGESFRTYGRHMGVTVAVVFGGVSHKPQIEALTRGVDVLVATPGRLIDHLDSRVVSLEAVEAFVLDEADQMLDLGFVRPIRRIVQHLRAKRQNLFFSATMPQEIAALAAELLNDPVRIAVTPVATTAERVSQQVMHIEAGKKKSLLVELLADPEMQRTLVFTRTKRGADRVARHLEAAGIQAAAIHGNKSQRQREIALDAFRNGKTGVLVATDIAARGIDIDAVSHVVNYELPEVPEAYVHRIGRTARAGAEGRAISLCDVAERDLLKAIERLTRQQIAATDRRNDAAIKLDSTMRPLLREERDDDDHRRDRSRHAPRRDGGGASARGGRHSGKSGSARDDRAAKGHGDLRHGTKRDGERTNAARRGGDHRDEFSTEAPRAARSNDKPRTEHHRDAARPARTHEAQRGERPHDARRPERGHSAAHAGKGGESHRRDDHRRGAGSSRDGEAVAHVFSGGKKQGGHHAHQSGGGRGQHNGERGTGDRGGHGHHGHQAKGHGKSAGNAPGHGVDKGHAGAKQRDGGHAGHAHGKRSNDQSGRQRRDDRGGKRKGDARRSINA